MNIYIIQGASGEWDTATEWIVSAHSTKSSAEGKLEKLNKYVEETSKIIFDNYVDQHNYIKETTIDQDIQWERSGVFYEILEIPLENN
jgi:hypothetical protein